MSSEVNVPEEFLERIPEIPASEQEPGEPSRETYALAVYVYEQILKTGAGEATAVMAVIDHVLKPIRSQERQRIREALALQANDARHQATEATQSGDWEKLMTAADFLECVTRIIFDSDPEQPAPSGVGSGAGEYGSSASAAPSVHDFSELEALSKGADEIDHLYDAGVKEWAELLLALEADGWQFVRSAPSPRAVQGEKCETCHGSRIWQYGVDGWAHPCPDCQPEKGGEG